MGPSDDIPSSESPRVDTAPAPWRLRLARGAGLMAVGGGAVYLSWRAPQLPGTGVMGALVFVAELVNYLAFALVAGLLWAPLRRPRPPRLPSASLDVLVPVCGEDAALVERTVRAALAIEYPHVTVVCNDGRLAGKDNWREIEQLCERLGVPCFTRTAGTPNKAGNLNFALNLTSAELVAVVDADHRARPDLADLTLGYFADPRLAFVASRQAFLVDDGDTLGNEEVFFYNCIQPAKDADNAAFSCGNGVVYRRAALQDVGGFCEWNVVEDLTTSYELHARGWRSAYVTTPLTVGLAPVTAAEYSRQRMRWAVDGLRLFFWDNPLLKHGLTLRQRLHYLITTGWYLVAALYLIFILAPVAWALFGVTSMRIDSTAGYVLRLVAYLVPVGVFLVAHAGLRGALRPAQMQLYLAPVYLAGILRALVARPMTSGVTSKSRQPRFSAVTVFQHMVLVVLVTSVGVGLARGNGEGWGVIVWACLLAGALAAPSSMVTVRRDSAQAMRVAVAAPVAVAAICVALVAWAPSPGAFLTDGVAQVREAGVAPVAASAEHSRPAVQRVRPPKRGVYLGAHSPELARPALSLESWHRRYGARLRIVHSFQDWWGPVREAPSAWLGAVADQRAIPMITWEPWRKPKGSVSDPRQRPDLVREIARGRHDRYVTSFARRIAAHRRPVLIRFMHEMNGWWYPWSVGVGRNTPQWFVRAWRRVHDIFAREGARNVSWVWSVEAFAGGAPTPRAQLRRFYPGRRYVDWVALSGFNWGERHAYGGWLAFSAVFGRAYRVVAGFRKPVMLAETGTATAGGDAGAWVRDAFSEVRHRFKRIKAFVFYDAQHPEQDFRIGEEARNGLRAAGRGRFWSPRPRLTRVEP